MMFVEWRIDIGADTPEEAARKAFELMRRPGTTATVFAVTEETGRMHKVDLMDEPEDADAQPDQ